MVTSEYFDGVLAAERPQNVLVNAGSASLNSIGIKIVTFAAYTLIPGYYICAVSTRGLNTAGANPGWAQASSGGAMVSDPSPVASNNMTPQLGGSVGSFPINNPNPSVGRNVGSALPHFCLRRV